jgi:hypothetical protein
VNRHVAFLSVAAVLALGLLFSPLLVIRTNATNPHDDRADSLRKARLPVMSALKDPLSAQFQNETLYGGTACGEVNAKNSLGGYVGFKRYISGSRGFLVEGNGFRTWKFGPNTPDYVAKSVERIDLGEVKDGSNDVFNWFWKETCK